ncbi:hypothetical protein JCM3770_004204 [Rhodotorula araucariae]
MTVPQYCTVCPNKTTKTCGACKAVFFCSIACQKAIWSTHKWTCGKPLDGVSHAPLSEEEVALLLDLDEMANGGTYRPWCWHNILKKDGLWSGGVEELLDSLKSPECSIVEPTRTLILADLRGNLFRAGCDYGILPDLVVTPWVAAGRLYRTVWRRGPSSAGFADPKVAVALVWSKTIRQYLVFCTLRYLRESGKGLPAGIADGVEALAMQRTRAAVEDIASTCTTGSSDDRQKLLGLLELSDGMHTPTPGGRTYIRQGQPDGSLKLVGIVENKD